MVLAGVYTSQKIIAQSPDEATFELTYDYPPEKDGGVIHETKRITIWAHKHLFRSASTFTKDGQPAELDVAVGVTTHDGRAQVTLNPKEGWMSCWETIDGKGTGTGVCMPGLNIKEMHEVKSTQPDASHAVLLTRTDREGKEQHLAGFAWSGAGEITTQAEWEKLLGTYQIP